MSRFRGWADECQNYFFHDDLDEEMSIEYLEGFVVNEKKIMSINWEKASTALN